MASLEEQRVSNFYEESVFRSVVVPAFRGHPKIPRLNRPVIITEKLDGSLGIADDPTEQGKKARTSTLQVLRALASNNDTIKEAA